VSETEAVLNMNTKRQMNLVKFFWTVFQLFFKQQTTQQST